MDNRKASTGLLLTACAAPLLAVRAQPELGTLKGLRAKVNTQAPHCSVKLTGFALRGGVSGALDWGRKSTFVPARNWREKRNFATSGYSRRFAATERTEGFLDGASRIEGPEILRTYASDFLGSCTDVSLVDANSVIATIRELFMLADSRHGQRKNGTGWRTAISQTNRQLAPM